MLYEEVRDTPRLAPIDWETRFAEGLLPDENNDWDAKIFRGTGVPLKDHPMKGSCNMHGCGNCDSDNVKVIYGQWSVSVANGDAYWDYEVVCEECGMFTSRSFSDT